MGTCLSGIINRAIVKQPRNQFSYADKRSLPDPIQKLKIAY